MQLVTARDELHAEAPGPRAKLTRVRDHADWHARGAGAETTVSAPPPLHAKWFVSHACALRSRDRTFCMQLVTARDELHAEAPGPKAKFLRSP